MSVKAIAQPKYIETGTKAVKDVKSAMIADASRLSTFRLLWILVKRHKVALLSIANIVVLLNWLVPEWTSLVGGFFSSIH